MNDPSILNAAFGMTRDIIDNYQHREKYQALIKEIRKNKHFFMSVINNQALQFSKLLIIHHQRDKLNQRSKFKINDDLSAEEKREINEIFLDFHQINWLCLEPLLIQYPQLEIPLLHYLEFDFPCPSINKDRKIELVNNVQLNEFLKRFWQHPSFSIIQHDINLIKDQSSMYFEKVRKTFEGEITTGNILNNSIFNKFTQLAEDTKEKRILNFIFALICLRKSINVMNELLFMAILEDKLPIVDETNILSSPTIFSDPIRNGLEVKCQFNNKNERLFGPEWLFIMNKDQNMNDNRTILNFCIERKISVTEDYGEEIKLLADNIDKNLNPYSNLLSS